MKSQSNFLKLKIKEAFSKIENAADNKECIKVWKKGESPSLYRLFNAKFKTDKDDGEIVASCFSEGDEVDKKYFGTQVFLSFELGELDYFCEGRVSSSESQFHICITDQVYRSENRIAERLMTFPHHQVYAYFKIIRSDSPDNVVELGQNQDQSYEEYKKAQKEELLSKISKHIKDTSNLSGFRALDISKTGIAFIIGQEERRYFQEDKPFNFLVLFNGEVIAIKNGKLVYGVDYAKSGSEGGTLKMGVTFLPNPELSQKIDVVIQKSNGLGQVQKEFEDLLDKK